MPTIHQVAERAGVSSTTVSHVINNTRFVTEETRNKVLEAMLTLGYRPNALARSLRRGETLTIGLILPDSANPFFAEIGRAIEDAAFNLQYNVILCNSEGDPIKESRYVEVLSKKQVDGIIFVGTGDQSHSLLSLNAQQIPVVLVDREIPDLEVDAVLTDNLQGGYLATRHLIDHGHKRIGCITGPSNITPSAQRVEGYRTALKERNLHVDAGLIEWGDFHSESGHLAAMKLLKLPDPPSAIFACNDLMAIGALYAAAECGFGIPHDLAIVGFDDIELASYVVPSLTTIAQPKADIGLHAVRLLVRRITEKTSPVHRELLPVTLIQRKSSGGHP